MSKEEKIVITHIHSFIVISSNVIMSGLHQPSMPTALFYGKKISAEQTPCSESRKALPRIIEKYPFKYLNPETPSCTWEVFHKQKCALEYAKRRMNGVMTFVCQTGTCGERLFLVAHPRVFWFYDCRREGQRCAYEIIAEHVFCKLYFDLEFSKESNPNHDGVRMTDTFITVIAHFLLKEWNIVCTREQVLDLDSSTDKKFSRHLIYQLPEMVFQDNYHVGNFVRKVCHALRSLKTNDGIHNVDIGINSNDFLELFIDNKGKQQLFCDEGVYTKNRHFRLYCSSKWNRKSPLVRSEENRWFCDRQPDDERLFLDSLITYFPVDKRYSILQCTFPSATPAKLGNSKMSFPSNSEKVSPYPDIDRFIQQLVAPGRIYRWYYSSSRNSLFYDIVGNRFCNNIGREHRSNNIRFIVDIEKKYFYQKCHDPDCKDFSSKPCLLPSELMFILEGSISFEGMEINESLWQNTFPEEVLSEVLDCIESNVLDSGVGEKSF